MLEDVLKAAQNGDAETAGKLLVEYLAGFDIGWQIDNDGHELSRVTIHRRPLQSDPE